MRPNYTALTESEQRIWRMGYDKRGEENEELVAAAREIEKEIKKFNDVDTMTMNTNIGKVAVYMASEVDKMLIEIAVALAALAEEVKG